MTYLNFNSFIKKTKESVVTEEAVNEAVNSKAYVSAGKLGYNDQFLAKRSLSWTLSVDLGLKASDEFVGPWLGFDHVSLYAIGKKGGTIIDDALTGKYTYDELKAAAADFLGIKESIVSESVNEDKFGGIADLTKSLHFEMDPKTAEEKKIELGKRQGEVTKSRQIEGGEYSLRRFRKEIKYGDGTYLGVFIPGSYDAAVSSLGDGPHTKKVKKVKWNQRKYDKWVSDLAYDNDGVGQGSSYGFEMAQNAKHEPGLIDFVKRSNRGEDPLQRIQWDIEAAMESVVNESVMSRLDLIRQESDSLEDFISTVYKTPGFKHFKGDKSFKGFLELTYDYTDQEAELAEKVNESAIDLLADEIEDAKAFDAFSDGDTVDARSTKKTWDDGVPVLKYIARAPKKSVKLPKKFKVVDDTKYGWWYLQISGVWYGIEQNDYPHGEQPFEY